MAAVYFQNIFQTKNLRLYDFPSMYFDHKVEIRLIWSIGYFICMH